MANPNYPIRVVVASAILLGTTACGSDELVSFEPSNQDPGVIHTWSDEYAITSAATIAQNVCYGDQDPLAGAPISWADIAKRVNRIDNLENTDLPDSALTPQNLLPLSFVTFKDNLDCPADQQ